MAKKVKFPLEMADGVQARTLEALKESFDVEKVVGYFLEGKLQTWLEDRYYEYEAEAVAALSAEDEQLGKKLSEIFGVEYNETVDVEEIAWRNERLAKLKQLTDDDEIIKNIDSVAFNQEELADLYEEGVEKIYLGEGEFTIPKSKQDLEYIEFAGAKVKGRKAEQTQTADTFTGNLELELRERYVFDPNIEETKTNKKGEVYNRKIHSLFRKGTDEMITDEFEDVDKFIVSSDNRIVYSVNLPARVYEENIRVFTRINNERPKCIAKHGRVTAIDFIYAGNKKVIYYLDSKYGTYTEFCIAEYDKDSAKRIVGPSDHHYYSLEAVWADDNKFWYRQIRDNILYRVNLSDIEGTKKNVIQHGVCLAKYYDGNLYTAVYKDQDTKFYKINTKTKKIEYIADSSYCAVSEMEICDNKIAYLSSGNLGFGLGTRSLYILDTETRKTIDADNDIDVDGGGMINTFEIIIKDNVVYYAARNHLSNKYILKRRINIDGTGKADIDINDTTVFKIGKA